jgi:hypothetical protein
MVGQSTTKLTSDLYAVRRTKNTTSPHITLGLAVRSTHLEL